jgi:ribosome recycling factor
MTLDEIYADTSERMDKTIEALKREFKTVRTGRASTALLESIKIPYYGALTPLSQVASLSAPEPTLLVVQPWDASVLPEIDKAIKKSNLGLNPNNDGKILRISVPPLSEERRKDLVKLIRKMAEDSRIAIRNERRDGNDLVKALEKDKEISEDDCRKGQDHIQKLTNEAIEQVDETLKKKEEEIMTL